MANEQFRSDDEIRDAFSDIIDNSFSDRGSILRDGMSERMRRMFDAMARAEDSLNAGHLPTDKEIADVRTALYDQWNRLGYDEDTTFYVSGRLIFGTDPDETPMELEDIAPEATSAAMRRYSVASAEGVEYLADCAPLRMLGIVDQLCETESGRPYYRIVLEFGFKMADDDDDGSDASGVEFDDIAWLTAHHADIHFMISPGDDGDGATEGDYENYDASFDTRAFMTEPLQEVLCNLRENFAIQCSRYGVDPNASEIDGYTINKLGIGAESELCHLNHRVKTGDIVSIHSGMIIGIDRDGTETRPLEILANREIYGTFDRVTVRRLPDEAFALLGTDSDIPPLGVGILIHDVVIVDETGLPCDELDGEQLDGKSVILIVQDENARLNKVNYGNTPEP